MIMPSKHINFSQSLLGFGSYILTKLENPMGIDDVWKMYQTDLLKNQYTAKHSFDNLMMTFILLYSINAIESKKGLIYKCN